MGNVADAVPAMERDDSLGNVKDVHLKSVHRRKPRKVRDVIVHVSSDFMQLPSLPSLFVPISTSSFFLLSHGVHGDDGGSVVESLC